MQDLQAFPQSAYMPQHRDDLNGSEKNAGQKTYYPACWKPIAFVLFWVFFPFFLFFKKVVLKG